MANIYNNAKEQFFAAGVDLDTDSIRCLLLRADAGFTPVYNPDNVTVADMLAEGGATGNEEASVGISPTYARQTLTVTGVNVNDTDDRGEAEATKASFATMATGQTIGAAVTFKFVTNDADSPVIGFYDVSDIPTNGGTVEIRWATIDGNGDFVRLQNLVNIYNTAAQKSMDGTLNLTSGTYKVMLLSSVGQTPQFFPEDDTTTELLAHAENVELVTTGYTAGGATLGAITTNQDDTAEEGSARTGKAVFTALQVGDTIGAAAIYRTSDSQLVAFYNLTDTPCNGGDIEILWNGVDGTGDFVKWTE